MDGFSQIVLLVILAASLMLQFFAVFFAFHLMHEGLSLASPHYESAGIASCGSCPVWQRG